MPGGWGSARCALFHQIKARKSKLDTCSYPFRCYYLMIWPTFKWTVTRNVIWSTFLMPGMGKPKLGELEGFVPKPGTPSLHGGRCARRGLNRQILGQQGQQRTKSCWCGEGHSGCTLPRLRKWEKNWKPQRSCPWGFPPTDWSTEPVWAVAPGAWEMLLRAGSPRAPGCSALTFLLQNGNCGLVAALLRTRDYGVQTRSFKPCSSFWLKREMFHFRPNAFPLFPPSWKENKAIQIRKQRELHAHCPRGPGSQLDPTEFDWSTTEPLRVCSNVI